MKGIYVHGKYEDWSDYIDRVAEQGRKELEESAKEEAEKHKQGRSNRSLV
jgi:hypothetical protein